MNTPNPSESALDSAVETVSTIPIVRKLFGYEKEAIKTVLAALASAQRDGKRLDWLIHNYGVDGCGERSLNFFYPEAADPRQSIDSAMSKEPPL